MNIFKWGQPKPLALEETKMPETFTLKGCWRRKEVVHPIADKDDVILLANTHPWTINATAEYKAAYTRIYGQAEADVLMVRGKPDMVEAFEQAWVQGGTFIPADPKPVPPVGTPTPYGNVQTVTVDLAAFEAMIDRVMVSVLKRVGLWSGQS